MLTELRNHVISLARLREGLALGHGCDAHRLPAELSAQLVGSRAFNLDMSEQQRCLQGTLVLHRQEAAHHRTITQPFDDAVAARRSA